MNKLYTQLFEKCRSKYDTNPKNLIKEKEPIKQIVPSTTKQASTANHKPKFKKTPTEKIIIKASLFNEKPLFNSTQNITKFYQTCIHPKPLSTTHRTSGSHIHSKGVPCHTFEINLSMREKLNRSKENTIDKKRKVQIKLSSSNNTSVDASFNKNSFELHATSKPPTTTKACITRQHSSNSNSTPFKFINAKKSVETSNAQSKLTLTISYIKDSESNPRNRKTEIPKSKGTKPLTAFKALAQFNNALSNFEQKEIITYKDIYFVGPHAKKIPSSYLLSKNNYGYDDADCDYIAVPHDHVIYRYEIISVIGRGSFGQVYW